MISVHESEEFLAVIKTIVKEGDENDLSARAVLEKLLNFFSRPTKTYSINQVEIVDQEKEDEHLFIEQVVLHEARNFLWSNFYDKLKSLDYVKG